MLAVAVMTARVLKSVFRNDLFLGNIAIITGGGTGIGKSIAKELSVLGCKVVIASRRAEILEECARVLNSELSEELVYPFPCNIRKEEEVKYYFTTKFCLLIIGFKVPEFYNTNVFQVIG